MRASSSTRVRSGERPPGAGAARRHTLRTASASFCASRISAPSRLLSATSVILITSVTAASTRALQWRPCGIAALCARAAAGPTRAGALRSAPQADDIGQRPQLISPGRRASAAQLRQRARRVQQARAPLREGLVV